MTPDLRIRRIKPGEHNQACDLILRGMREHWGETFDSGCFPDLRDIQNYYREGVFLVARMGGKVIGTGALLPEGRNTARVCRMSVDRSCRRIGIGTKIFQELSCAARGEGVRTLLCETTASWEGARAFYTALGFSETGYQDGDVHFRQEL